MSKGAKEALEELLVDLKKGPVGARVSQVQVEWSQRYGPTSRFHDLVAGHESYGSTRNSSPWCRDESPRFGSPARAAAREEDDATPIRRKVLRPKHRERRVALRNPGRAEGLDTIKSYLREVRKSTLLNFKQEQSLGQARHGR